MIFFFQAEDGIRDTSVTGVQTYALPIFIGSTGNIRSPLGANRMSQPAASARGKSCPASRWYAMVVAGRQDRSSGAPPQYSAVRSEERRVGKEWRSRDWTDDEDADKECEE